MTPQNSPPVQSEDLPPSDMFIENMIKNGMLEEAKLYLDKWKHKFDDNTVAKYNQKLGSVSGESSIQKSSAASPLIQIPSITTEGCLAKFITVHPQMIELKAHVRKLARISDPVLIHGPSGTGKELIAQALHGDRKGRFVSINCPALHEHLIESELFGHTKGSFTGAVSDRIGKMLYARDGTLFLDEIADLPIALQGKLLRAIQERSVSRLGENKEMEINCRIVCATHKNLHALIEDGKFREDLYYRISAFELETLCLYKRPEDIVLIAKSLGAEGDFLQRLEETVQNKVCRFDGNVRELQQAVRRWQVLGKL